METTIKERIKAFCGYKHISVRHFERACGFANGYVNSLKNAPNVDRLSTIISTYPEINKIWLLTGEGEMLRPEASGPSSPSAEVPHADEPHRVPLIPGVAKGGTLGEYADPVRSSECGLIVTPVPAAELAITVSGESMEPDYPAGSVALLRRIDEASFIEWGRAYVLDTVNGAVLKLLAPSDREGHVRCLSINPSPAFAPFDVPLPDIHGIYRVLACIIFH